MSCVCFCRALKMLIEQSKPRISYVPLHNIPRSGLWPNISGRNSCNEFGNQDC